MNKYRIFTAALSSKATVDDFTFGRSSDWLLISDAFPRSRYVESGSGNRYISEILSEFHSSGTVRDLHPIPF